MEISGKVAILTIGGISLAMASFAVWVHYDRGRRSIEFWERDNAVLIRHASRVEILNLDPVESIDSPTISLDGRDFAATNTIDISQARGLVHARYALIHDMSFQWEQETDGCVSDWSQPCRALRFTEGDRQIVVAFDERCGRLHLVGADREVTLVPKTRDALKAKMDEWAKPPDPVPSNTRGRAGRSHPSPRNKPVESVAAHSTSLYRVICEESRGCRSTIPRPPASCPGTQSVTPLQSLHRGAARTVVFGQHRKNFF